ncbi:hypothetical protein BBK36DRAFT_1159542 [Trichoderma citrinoviride]|uniref:Uncharacterized protein n=1 Tax=Trichoderma citrinoviride TaxID=58853 RepID=A0A2T4BB01_9HYPO|nr:hypothetical protein BBK36DRAFT_1159542 [Trichoderma citrinoviride]PTB66510.1 hypothetical protein BBK36DRAFT_1159542 [Trichoderma citrinoviride]
MAVDGGSSPEQSAIDLRKERRSWAATASYPSPLLLDGGEGARHGVHAELRRLNGWAAEASRAADIANMYPTGKQKSKAGSPADVRPPGEDKVNKPPSSNGSHSSKASSSSGRISGIISGSRSSKLTSISGSHSKIIRSIYYHSSKAPSISWSFRSQALSVEHSDNRKAPSVDAGDSSRGSRALAMKSICDRLLRLGRSLLCRHCRLQKSLADGASHLARSLQKVGSVPMY